MSKINFLKPDRANLNTFLYLGSFLFLISFLDVFFNSFFDLNLTGFLPNFMSFVLPLILGFIGLYFIRIEYSGIKRLYLLNKDQIIQIIRELNNLFYWVKMRLCLC